MSANAPAILAGLAIVAGVLLVARKAGASLTGHRVALPYVMSEAAGQGGDVGQLVASAPVPVDHERRRRNVAAFLRMIRAAEGTAPDDGYGALFGWPAIAGRSFDPYSLSGHPRQFFNYTDKAGKTIRTSAAGAYQITYTTWAAYYVPFVAWCGVNGRECSGFTPATQDAFAEFLLWRDGALDDVEAGRLDAALTIARRRWASLPGAGYDQPERSRQFVLNAYTNAGGTLA